MSPKVINLQLRANVARVAIPALIRKIATGALRINLVHSYADGVVVLLVKGLTTLFSSGAENILSRRFDMKCSDMDLDLDII